MTENDLLSFWTNFLRLDGFRVVHVSADRPTDPVRLTVLPTAAVALCPHCQRPCDSIHRHYQSEPVKDCQGTRTFTRLRDTNCYEHNRQPRTTRGRLPLFPDPSNHGNPSLLTAAADC